MTNAVRVLCKRKRITLTTFPEDPAIILAKIQVESQDDTPFGVCLLKNLAVRQPRQTFLAQMHHFMACGSQPLNDLHRDTHVGQKLQVISPLRRADLFLG